MVIKYLCINLYNKINLKVSLQNPYLKTDKDTVYTYIH